MRPYDKTARPLPSGALAAALLCAGIVAAAPFLELDRAAVETARAELLHRPPRVVAVALDGQDARAVAALAAAGGAAEVRGPTTDPLPAPRRAPVARITARALVVGRAPAAALAGRTVVIDEPARALARAADLAAERTPPPAAPLRAILAALAGVLALGAALAVGRLRPRWGVLPAAVSLVTAAVALVAALGATPPALELALVLPLAAWAGVADRARCLARLVDAVAPPVLRAAAEMGAAARIEGTVGPGLAELLGARGLLILEAPPGARKVRPGAGWRLGAEDLSPDAPLDLRRAPFRDPGGVARAGHAALLLARPAHATLLPLSTRGTLEGWLLVVHEPHHTLRAGDGLREVCAAVAEDLRLARNRSRPDMAPALLDAAHTLDAAAATVAQAAARAHSAIALVAASGTTRWKNARFDEALAMVATHSASDLGRVLALFRRLGEAPLETLQRLVVGDDGDGPARAVVPELGLVATAAPAGPGLLVEIVTLDEQLLETLAPTPAPALRAESALPMGS